MKVVLIILLLISSVFTLALLIIGIVGVIIAGQWRDFDEWINNKIDEE